MSDLDKTLEIAKEIAMLAGGYNIFAASFDEDDGYIEIDGVFFYFDASGNYIKTVIDL